MELEGFAHDPVHEEAGQWYFWDEIGADRLGPYPTEIIARQHLERKPMRMGWTRVVPNKKSLPGRVGTYLYRGQKHFRETPVRVCLEGDNGWITFIGEQHSHDIEEYAKEDHGEFLGPIKSEEKFLLTDLRVVGYTMI